MPKILRLNKGAEEGIRELLRFLLESKKVKGVFTLARMGKNEGVAYSLIAVPDALKDALPLFPLMPANAGKALSHLTLAKPAAEPIAAVVRPCELRALTELIKRSQGSLDNFLFISSTCGGVYPLEMAVNGNIGEELPQYWDAVKKGDIVSGIRVACASCEHFVPYNADLTITLIGSKDGDKQCEISLNTDKGEQFAAGIAGELTEGEVESGAIESLRSKKEAQKKVLLDEIGGEDFNIQEFFGKCIGCHNCSNVCPICYCRLCFFDSGGDEHEPRYYETELSKMGYARVLPDPVFYQLVRLSHVSISCVGCGSCEDACPVNIPLGAISLKVGAAVQKAFDYLPGRDIEEELPLTTSVPEEFATIER